MELVLIEWVDSAGSEGWHSLEDLKSPESLYCKSVGWLLCDGVDWKTIIPHISDHQGRGEITIPSKCIIKITKIPLP